MIFGCAVTKTGEFDGTPQLEGFSTQKVVAVSTDRDFICVYNKNYNQQLNKRISDAINA